jgi:tRNA C32,U32 (ribose-2'-O)-methylase TrmJ
MRLVLIAAKDIPLTTAGRSMADLASKLLTNKEVTPTLTEVEATLPLAVQVNIRPRTEADTVGEVPEEAKETIKGKAMLMRWMPLSTPSKPWTIWRLMKNTR